MSIACVACSVITGDLGRTIAIEVDGPSTVEVEEANTTQLSARAIDAAGDTVPDAIIVWELMDIDSGQVGFDLDSLSGSISARYPGSGGVRARVEGLSSDTITVVVTGAPDSMEISGDSLLSMDSDSLTSPDLEVIVYDLTTNPDSVLPLANKPVIFAVVYPAPESPDAAEFFLSAGDSVPGLDPHRVVAWTTLSGRAAVVARRESGAAMPDSIVVDAIVLTAIGDTVSGSPIRFYLTLSTNP